MSWSRNWLIWSGLSSKSPKWAEVIPWLENLSGCRPVSGVLQQDQMYLTAHGPKFNYDLPVSFNSGLGKNMVDHQKTVGGDKPRAGKQFRSNTDRYFHVMGQGWYALVREGINGPYLTKELAREFVIDLIRSMVSDEKKESWRHNPI